ncbi:MAG: hypothetical protein LBS28_04210 [Streptococcaceae bacterium]|jgi:hypothetical protein|nr:hypothetical protein [Streptococcaceae bacterium]
MSGNNNIMKNTKEKRLETAGVILLNTSFLIELVFFMIDFFNGFITFRKILQLFFMFLFCVSATYSLFKKKSFFDKFFNKDGTIKDEYKEYLEKKQRKN